MDNNNAQKWEEVLNVLKSTYPTTAFNTWFKTITFDSVNNNVLNLYSSNSVHQNMLTNRYSKELNDIIKTVFGEEYSFNVSLFVESEKNKQKQFDNATKSNLNPKYTFDSYIVGNSNIMAHAASLAVAEAPGKTYNPLFLYGGVGLGKTHLMHAIGNYIIENNPNAKVLYVSSEKFTIELINAIRDNSSENFRNKYRNIDVLLIDDIQFIAGKESTQEEFFHTFNTLYDNNKQIIISSDKPPTEIERLEDRLRSRFVMGLIADIQSPNLETRMAILKQKAKEENYEDKFNDDVFYFLANTITSNIRQLEGAITRIIMMSKLINAEITVELAKDSIKEIISQKPNQITIPYIQEIVADYYSLNVSDFKAKKKNQAIAIPRQIAMYLSRKLTDTSFPKIGQEFGGRDHTTVLHAYEKISTELETNNELKNLIETLENKIKVS